MIIDPHVHLRDWEQSGKETIFHGMETACLCGVGALFDMPNTVPTLTEGQAISRRLEDAERAARLLQEAGGKAPFYALYAGLTADAEQIHTVLRLHEELFPRVIGLKLFAGRSTGDLAVIDEGQQRRIWKVLADGGYRGVVAVHCEKEAKFRPEEWTPSLPSSHSQVRPEEAEAASVEDQLCFAEEAGFEGNLHICHISSKAALDLLARVRKDSGRHSVEGEGTPRQSSSVPVPFSVSCGVTPHHLLLDTSMIPEKEEGLLFKVNPPLRSPETRARLLEALKKGAIDWIESDHAPHRWEDKYDGHASGIPSLSAWPRISSFLKEQGFSAERIAEITGGAVLKRYGIDGSLVPDFPLAAAKGGDSTERYDANCWRSI